MQIQWKHTTPSWHVQRIENFKQQREKENKEVVKSINANELNVSKTDSQTKGIYKQIENVKKTIQQVKEDETMSSKQKSDQLKEMQKELQELQKQLVEVTKEEKEKKIEEEKEKKEEDENRHLTPEERERKFHEAQQKMVSGIVGATSSLKSAEKMSHKAQQYMAMGKSILTKTKDTPVSLVKGHFEKAGQYGREMMKEIKKSNKHLVHQEEALKEYQKHSKKEVEEELMEKRKDKLLERGGFKKGFFLKKFINR